MGGTFSQGFIFLALTVLAWEHFKDGEQLFIGQRVDVLPCDKESCMRQFPAAGPGAGGTVAWNSQPRPSVCQDRPVFCTLCALYTG